MSLELCHYTSSYGEKFLVLVRPGKYEIKGSPPPKILPTSGKILLKNQRHNGNLQIEHISVLIKYSSTYKEKTYIWRGTQKFPELLKKLFKIFVHVWNFSPLLSSPSPCDWMQLSQCRCHCWKHCLKSSTEMQSSAASDSLEIFGSSLVYVDVPKAFILNRMVVRQNS
jgi:hypothetical protein